MRPRSWTDARYQENREHLRPLAWSCFFWTSLSSVSFFTNLPCIRFPWTRKRSINASIRNPSSLQHFPVSPVIARAYECRLSE